ncbi:MAG: hypothetical protein WCG55_03350 [bacterium]
MEFNPLEYPKPDLASSQKENSVPENWREVLEDKMFYAHENAVPLVILQKPEDQLTEAEKKLWEKASIRVKTLAEYQALQAMLLRKQEHIDDDIAHENAHANKAESLGMNFHGYKVIVGYRRNGLSKEYFYLNSVEISTPNEWSAENDADAFKQVLLAPDENGASVSSGLDHKMLDKLNRGESL